MPLLDILWTMLWFFVVISWIWMLISIISDTFASNMSGCQAGPRGRLSTSRIR